MTSRKIINSKLKEAVDSVLPITIIVAVLCFFFLPVGSGLMLAFLVGAVLLIVGMGLFTLGAELSMTQMGNLVGALEVPRLARSTKQLCEIIEIINAKHLRLVIVGSITMDCRNGHADPMTEAFLQMAGVFSQLELAMIRARVKSGMANARAKGASIGRPRTTVDDVPPVFLRHYPAYRNGKLNVSELSRVCNISRTTAYKYLSLLQ